jgi:solute carrier family 66, member 2
MLPLPQIAANARARSCRGFRSSVLAFWLLGDAMKMLWFFTATSEIPWPFKLCGLFQAGCDLFLGWQYVTYGSGEPGWPGQGKTLGNGVTVGGRSSPLPVSGKVI